MRRTVRFTQVARVLSRSLLAAVTLASSTAMMGCEEEKQAEPVEVAPRPVRYTVAKVVSSAKQREFSGTSKASTEAALSFKVQGTLDAIEVKVGDEVKEGQLIAKIDPTDLKLQVEQAKASVSQASAQSRNAKLSYKRTLKLYENQTASKSDLDSARAAYDSARAQVSSASKQVQLLKSQAGYSELKAPMDGTISMVNVDLNENVSPGQPIVTLTAGDDLEIEVAVPEVIIGEMAKGDRCIVRFDAMGDENFEGVVAEVGVAPSSGASTFPVTIQIKEGVEKLRPGLAAVAEFTLGNDDPPAIYLPSFAVANDKDGSFVWTLKRAGDGRGTTHRRDVTVGEVSERGLEIKEGINEGDLVATAGVTYLSEGKEVAVPAGAEEGAAKPGAAKPGGTEPETQEPKSPANNQPTEGAPGEESPSDDGSEPTEEAADPKPADEGEK